MQDKGIRWTCSVNPNGFRMTWFQRPPGEPNLLSETKTWLDWSELLLTFDTPLQGQPSFDVTSLGSRYGNLTPVSSQSEPCKISKILSSAMRNRECLWICADVTIFCTPESCVEAQCSVDTVLNLSIRTFFFIPPAFTRPSRSRPECLGVDDEEFPPH